MKHLLLTAVLLAASPTFAGGPVIVEDDYTAEATAHRSGNLVPILIGVLILCAIACGNSDDPAPAVVPGPVCKSGC